MGKPIRDNKGRFSSITKKLKKGFGYVACALFIILVVSLYNGARKADVLTFRAEANQEIKTIEIDTLPQKIEELKDEVVEEIAECESNNASQDVALVVYDNNSKGTLTGKHVASIGVMQFKVATVQMFYKTLHGKELTNYEATTLALGNDRAKELAKEAIFGIKGALWHWSCATEEMGNRVTIIRELLKV